MSERPIGADARPFYQPPSEPTFKQKLKPPVIPDDITVLGQPRLVTERPLPEQEIFKSYNPFNDANTLRKYADLSPEQQYNLTFAQVAGFGDEFAGKIKKKTIAGIMHADGRLEMFGIDTMAMYQRTADMAGFNSREYYEWLGLHMIYQSFLQRARDEEEGKSQSEGHNAADWVSSPKDANYGVLYAQRLGPRDNQTGDRLFVEYIFMYDEALHSLEESRRIYNTITAATGQPDNRAGTFTSYTDFLSRPILFNTSQPDDLSYIYRTLGITERDIRRAVLFQQASRSELMLLINNYFHIVKTWSQLPTFGKSDQANRHFSDQARMYLGAFYNAAKQIKNRIDDMVMLEEYRPLFTFHTEHNHEQLQRQAQQLAVSDRLVIYGGSNCEVTKSSVNGIPSMNTIVERLEQGVTLNRILQSANGEFNSKIEDFPCPKCNKTIPGGKGHNACPHCGVTKWQVAAEKGEAVCA